MSPRKSSRKRRPNPKFEEEEEPNWTAPKAPQKPGAFVLTRKHGQMVHAAINSTQLTPNAAITGSDHIGGVSTRSKSGGASRPLQNVSVDFKQTGVKRSLSLNKSEGAAVPSSPVQTTNAPNQRAAQEFTSPRTRRSPSKRPQRMVKIEQPSIKEEIILQTQQQQLKFQPMQAQAVRRLGEPATKPQLQQLQSGMPIFKIYNGALAEEFNKHNRQLENIVPVPIDAPSAFMCPISSSPSSLLTKSTPLTQLVSRDSWMAGLTTGEIDTWIDQLEAVPPQGGVSPYVLPHSLVEDIA